MSEPSVHSALSRSFASLIRLLGAFFFNNLFFDISDIGFAFAFAFPSVQSRVHPIRKIGELFSICSSPRDCSVGTDKRTPMQAYRTVDIFDASKQFVLGSVPYLTNNDF